MWVSPNHPDRERLLARQSERPAPPEDDGERLVTLDRPGRDGRADQELRLSIQDFNGSRFVRVQGWTRNAQGEVWPERGRSVTFRARELPAVIAALRKAEKALAPQAAGTGRPARDMGALPETPRGGDGSTFSEFHE